MKTLARADDRADLRRRLERVDERSQPRWGRMSAHGMACHLADAFRMATGERRVAPRTGLLQRTLLKWIVLYAPLRWPGGIRTSPELDQELGGTRPQAFAADVAQAVELMETLPTLGSLHPSHPIFGTLSRDEWLRWGYLHTDHHLRQFGA